MIGIRFSPGLRASFIIYSLKQSNHAVDSAAGHTSSVSHVCRQSAGEFAAAIQKVGNYRPPDIIDKPVSIISPGRMATAVRMNECVDDKAAGQHAEAAHSTPIACVRKNFSQNRLAKHQ